MSVVFPVELERRRVRERDVDVHRPSLAVVGVRVDVPVEEGALAELVHEHELDVFLEEGFGVDGRFELPRGVRRRPSLEDALDDPGEVAPG